MANHCCNKCNQERSYNTTIQDSHRTRAARMGISFHGGEDNTKANPVDSTCNRANSCNMTIPWSRNPASSRGSCLDRRGSIPAIQRRSTSNQGHRCSRTLQWPCRREECRLGDTTNLDRSPRSTRDIRFRSNRSMDPTCNSSFPGCRMAGGLLDRSTGFRSKRRIHFGGNCSLCGLCNSLGCRSQAKLRRSLWRGQM